MQQLQLGNIEADAFNGRGNIVINAHEIGEARRALQMLDDALSDFQMAMQADRAHTLAQRN